MKIFSNVPSALTTEFRIAKISKMVLFILILTSAFFCCAIEMTVEGKHATYYTIAADCRGNRTGKSPGNSRSYIEFSTCANTNS